MTSESVEDVEWAVCLIKTKTGVELKSLEEHPGPSSIEELYKEIVLLIRNFDAEHFASVHAAKVTEAVMKMQGVQKSGIVTPPGVKT